MKGRRITQGFGGNHDMYARFNLLGHNGIDISAPIGTILISPISGTVKEVNFDDNGYGWYVLIENDQEGALIAHMSEVTVKVEFTVNQGDKLGLSGNTGNSTGPHTHFGYFIKPRNRSNGYNGYIDPTPYFAAIGGADMSDTNVTQLNTYGLDDTNLQSKQAVYDAWHDLSSGKYIIKDDSDKLQAELNQKITDLTKENDFLHQKFDEDLKLLGQFQDLGFKTVEDVTKISIPYAEMYKQGYINLEVIQAKLAGFILQREDDKKTIADLTDRLNKSIDMGAPTMLENIELKKENEALKLQVKTTNPVFIWKWICKFVGLIISKLPKKAQDRVPDILTKITTEPPSIERTAKVVDAWTQLANSIKGTN